MQRMKQIGIATASMTVIVWALLITSLGSPIHSAKAHERQVTVFLNQTEIHFSNAPIIVDGYTYVPIREIFEAFGLAVDWDKTNQLIRATKNDWIIEYPINGDILYVNGKERRLERTSMIVDGHALAPLRLIGESLGGHVSWDSSTYTASIARDALTLELPQVAPTRHPDNGIVELTPEVRDNQLFDYDSGFLIQVRHYGVEDHKLYSLIELRNEGDQDVYLSMTPSDKKVVRFFSKVADPRPEMKLQDCTIVTIHSVNILKRIYNIPEFSTDAECEASNEAKKAEFKEWLKHNNGYSIAGEQTINVARYIQNEEGALQDFLIPAHGSEMLVIIGATGDADELVASGNYRFRNDTGMDADKDYELYYQLGAGLDLGIYEFIYTIRTQDAIPMEQSP